MTVSSTTRTAGPYVGTGTVTTYPFSFVVFKNTDVLVQRVDLGGNISNLVYGSDYTVTLNANQSTSPGGTIALTVALPTGYQLVMTSQVPALQGLDIQNPSAWYPDVVMTQFDYLTVLIQQILTTLSGSLQLPLAYAPGVSPQLPAPVANKLIGWNTAATGLQNFDASTLASIVAFGTANADVATGDGASTVFALTANPGAQANLDVSVAGVTKVPGVDYAWSGGQAVTFTSAPANGAKVLIRYLQALPQGATDSAASTWIQSLVGAVMRTVSAKLRETVSVFDFGVVGDGVTDDTVNFSKALASAAHVIVPAGYKFLISSTLTVAAGCWLEFLTGIGPDGSGKPASCLIKAASMNATALAISSNGLVTGGGVFGTPGNGGLGIQLIGNGAKVRDTYVAGCGSHGVRVGTDGGANCNSFELEHVVCYGNGGKGFYVHDGTAASGANANAGTLRQCFAQSNGDDGFTLGHCFWVKVDHCLAESNTGAGLRLSGTANNTYPECRWATVTGGDFNEGNGGGAIIDQSYCSRFDNPDPNNVPTNAGVGGLQGSGLRNVITSLNGTVLTGATVKSSAGLYPLTVDDGSAGSLTSPLVLKKTTTGGNGQGLGIAWSINDGSAGYVQAGGVRVTQSTSGQWSMMLSGYKSGAALDMLDVNVNAMAVRPAQDNVIASGFGGQRWSVVYAGTGTINTSDAREKQDVAALSDAEKRVGVRLKALVKSYRWTAAVQAKGSAARTHVGWIAQDVMGAFQAEGLDPFAYGVCCHDSWPATDAVIDEEGHVLSPAQAAGDLYSVRHDELVAFVIGAT